MIVIISDDSSKNYGSVLKEEILKMGKKVVCFKANELNIESCCACGSCGGKTFGKCILQDDLSKILSSVIKSKKIILVSPIVFGGVSSYVKKIMDRISSIGDPRYFVKDGELVKKMRIKDLEYYMIGIKDNVTETEKFGFKKLHSENIKIMSVSGKSFVINSKLESIGKVIKEILYE